MKTIIILVAFVFSFGLTSVSAQNVKKGNKTEKNTPSIPNYNFTPARSMDDLKDMQAKGITETAMLQQEAEEAATPKRQYVRRVGVVSNIPGNYVAERTVTPTYNPVLKEAASHNPRVSQSKPVNITKTVRVAE